MERDELVTICHRFESMKHSTASPLAFTEHGVAMLAGVLNGERAVRISIGIVQAFVRLQRLLASQARLAQKLEELEGRVAGHDAEITAILDALRTIMTPPEEAKPRRIGFHLPD
jgi:hypothetical protein